MEGISTLPRSRSAMGTRAVFLVGFMGSGKSSVGQELGRRLAWDFVDLDARIEARERQSIAEIFQDKGEPAFRELETSALGELIQSLTRNGVVALGGGAFAQPANRELLRIWTTVFLEAPVDELWRRSSEDEEVRPLRRNREQFGNLYRERLPFYQQATLVVATAGKDLTTICSEIEDALQLGSGAGFARSQTHSVRPETGGSQ